MRRVRWAAAARNTLGEGVTIGRDNVVARGARIFPGVVLPDGAIEF